MKTAFLFFALLVSNYTFSAIEVTCKSANYMVQIVQSESKPEIVHANYGVNGWVNDAADVEVSEIYFSQKMLAASITVDGQKDKFVLSVNKFHTKNYVGHIYVNSHKLHSQLAKCTEQYIVIAEERDDDTDMNN